MSKPLKPWFQTQIALPDDGTTVWIRQQPAFWTPVQATCNAGNRSFDFYVNCNYPSLPPEDNPVAVYFQLPFSSVFAWRNL